MRYLGITMMNTISLRTNHTNDVTIISNIFIDRYMPTASGAYVKVYLYLLRCLSNHHLDLSISTIADRLEDTEKDILRAISYWEKVQLITVSRDSDGKITNITFNTPAGSDSSKAETSPMETTTIEASLPLLSEEPVSPKKHYTEFVKPTYTKVQIDALSTDNTVQFMMNAVESYLEHPIRPTELQLILFLYESVGFSADLIMYLFEYCISENKRHISYIEKVALTWANEGITTEEKAKAHTNQYSKITLAVNKAFGLNRALGEKEREYITKWTKVFGLPKEFIIEACNRTLLRVGKPDFNYADKILASWHANKVTTMDDIKQLDSAHAKQGKAQAKTTQPAKPAPNKFNNFTGRNYSKEDFIKMEQLLLKNQ